MTEKEAIILQGLNRFSYAIGIPRTQTSLALVKYFFLSDYLVSVSTLTIIKNTGGTNIEFLQRNDDRFNFNENVCAQVGRDLIAYSFSYPMTVSTYT